MQGIKSYSSKAASNFSDDLISDLLLWLICMCMDEFNHLSWTIIVWYGEISLNTYDYWINMVCLIKEGGSNTCVYAYVFSLKQMNDGNNAKSNPLLICFQLNEGLIK